MKPRLLIYSDFFGAGTGFGTVSRHLILALKAHFDVDQLAINYQGQFFDAQEWPVQVVPARLGDPRDPYGARMFLDAVATGRYAAVWVMNDPAVVDAAGRQLAALRESMRQAGRDAPAIVYYAPIDGPLAESASGMFQAADRVVAYSDYGRREILKTLPGLASRLDVIPHGTDGMVFGVADLAQRRAWRRELLALDDDDDTFVWLNVNRNSPRKDLPKTLLAFSEFRRHVPGSRLYLHTVVRELGLDLDVCARSLGLLVGRDVCFTPHHAVQRPAPIGWLQALYNAADAFITTSLGEGWGLTDKDAMRVRKPVVAPAHTVFVEQFGQAEVGVAGARGYLYPCRDRVCVDIAGYRPVGYTADIVDAMRRCHAAAREGADHAMLDAAQAWAAARDWRFVGKQWQALFEGLPGLH